jgi:hypothetical protein
MSALKHRSVAAALGHNPFASRAAIAGQLARPIPILNPPPLPRPTKSAEPAALAANPRQGGPFVHDDTGGAPS